MELFSKTAEFIYLPKIIGSGHEKDIAKLAIEDGIAYRAARKNMQIHSAILLKVAGEFAGFFTFQNNVEIGEFCLLQSTIKPEYFSHELYAEMVAQVIKQNTSNFAAFITTDPRSKFETPALFKSLGFVTYLAMSGFEYMVLGDIKAARVKHLAHVTMCNVWNSISGKWLALKREWNEKIEAAGLAAGIATPKYATRGGCWQGDSGMSNVVLTKRSVVEGEVVVDSTKSLNSNASVLDPVACEVILRMFMPKDGRLVYNPFGGGVQMGFVTAHEGFDYVASEIRNNQCDANNAICAKLAGRAEWRQSDSSTYSLPENADLVFTCPPYYRVEKYVDYDGEPPPGEINSMGSYGQFRDTLFAGYERAIERLNNDCFFVVMTGDSRDKHGAFYCCEAEHAMFFKEHGLHIYNQIVYLECEFTRLAHAKKTLNSRKFPKREQKIIVAYKGSIPNIPKRFAPIGRL